MQLVSAIITTHNRKELLSRAINSVLNQTYKNIECIVIDDASSDGTNELCQNSKITYIYIPSNESRGGNYARNLGIKAASGKYCAFLDDDDYWLPTKIEKQVSLIEQMNCEMVYCGCRQEIINTNIVRYRDVMPISYLCGDMQKKILQNICTTTTNMLVRKQALLDVGLFDENLRFWQEYELTIRLAQRSPFYFVNEPLSVYRIDKKDKNRLTNKYLEWREAVNYIHKKHAVLYENLSIIEKYNSQSLIWNDASKRCRLSGLYVRAVFFYILSLPCRLKNKFRR